MTRKLGPFDSLNDAIDAGNADALKSGASRGGMGDDEYSQHVGRPYHDTVVATMHHDRGPGETMTTWRAHIVQTAKELVGLGDVEGHPFRGN